MLARSGVAETNARTPVVPNSGVHGSFAVAKDGTLALAFGTTASNALICCDGLWFVRTSY